MNLWVDGVLQGGGSDVNRITGRLAQFKHCRTQLN